MDKPGIAMGGETDKTVAENVEEKTEYCTSSDEHTSKINIYFANFGTKHSTLQ